MQMKLDPASAQSLSSPQESLSAKGHPSGPPVQQNGDSFAGNVPASFAAKQSWRLRQLLASGGTDLACDEQLTTSASSAAIPSRLRIIEDDPSTPERTLV
jgi:hypothetical protein